MIQTQNEFEFAEHELVIAIDSFAASSTTTANSSTVLGELCQQVKRM